MNGGWSADAEEADQDVVALTSPFTRERVTGIEPAFSAWEADVLPLNYTRVRTRTVRRGVTARHTTLASTIDAYRTFAGTTNTTTPTPSWCRRGAVIGWPGNPQ